MCDNEKYITTMKYTITTQPQKVEEKFFGVFNHRIITQGIPSLFLPVIDQNTMRRVI